MSIPYVISVDPGAVHCGVAYWNRLPSSVIWRCDWAVEMTYEECIDYVADLLRDFPDDLPEHLYCEGFWLKSGKDALRQSGSAMETVEVIGVLKNLCRWSEVPFTKVPNGQQAIIHRMNAAGYKWSSMGHGGHAKDAEAVGINGMGLSVSRVFGTRAPNESIAR